MKCGVWPSHATDRKPERNGARPALLKSWVFRFAAAIRLNSRAASGSARGARSGPRDRAVVLCWTAAFQSRSNLRAGALKSVTCNGVWDHDDPRDMTNRRRSHFEDVSPSMQELLLSERRAGGAERAFSRGRGSSFVGLIAISLRVSLKRRASSARARRRQRLELCCADRDCA